MHTEDLLFKFRERLSVLNRSPSTVKAYIMHIESFLSSMDASDIKQISSRMIETYIANLYDYRTDKGNPYRIGTICIKIRSLKRFFEFLESSNIIFINPTEWITEPKKEKTAIRETLNAQEIKRILDQPNLGTLSGIRDRAVLEVFYSTGIRLNELCGLTIYDADLQGGMLRINKGKGFKDRVVPLGKHSIRFLKEYISKVRPHFTRKNRQTRDLFVDCYGKPLSKQVVSIMIRTWRNAAKIKKQVTAHMFRHTFATDLIRNGADITAVQKMMGHAELKTTEGYIKSLGLDVKKAHQKTHPREKEKETPQSIKPQISMKKGRYEGK